MSITIDPATTKPPTRDNANPPAHLPVAKEEKQHPSEAGGENASVYFVGTATTILCVCTFYLLISANGIGNGRAFEF